MKKINTTILNPYKLSIRGQHLIEASAGTGKTYAIILIYLRLILGINNKKNTRILTVKDILIVTFTEAAVNELKKRIRDYIHIIKNLCKNDINSYKTNIIHKKILSLITNKKVAFDLLNTAENNINEACIYTIHSFCQQLLHYNSLEFNMSLKYNIIANEHAIQKQACNDFWRRTFYSMPYDIVKIISTEWNSPEQLLSEIQPYLQGDMPLFLHNNNKNISIIKQHNIFINKIKKIKFMWKLFSNEINTIIINANINKRRYNNRNISIWLKKITHWAYLPTKDYDIPKELIKFSKTTLINNSNNTDYPKHKIFSLIEDTLKIKYTLRDIIIMNAIFKIKKNINYEKKKLDVIGFEDLLNLVDYGLRSKNKQILINSIINKYPIAIIDEFQDTDPIQYRIFKNIYYNCKKSCLILIGDPKQAIYGFRGANIFTYFKAKKEIKSHFTLVINYRSSFNMISAINRLFKNIKNPFLFKALKFNDIKTTPNNKNYGIIHNNNELSAINIIYFNQKTLSISNYQKIMAYQCAIQISNWLNESKKGNIWIYNNKTKSTIKSSDIIILVKNHQEAKIISNALKQFNIHSLFLSNRNNIFCSKEALDILWILHGIYFYNQKNKVQRALATNLINLNIEELINLNTNEQKWEEKLKKFLDFSYKWKKYGIISALYSIIYEYHIHTHLLNDKINGKRRMTNLMHLIELLQQEDCNCDTQYSLIQWLEQQIKEPNTSIHNQQLHIEDDKSCIHISTIHKAKGLEYPIVFLPFACYITKQKIPIFHDRKTFIKHIDLLKSQNSLHMYEEERLSEDLRLLYVALTRAIYHCSIGLAPIVIKDHQNNDTDMHKLAIGYLLQNGKIGNINTLNEHLTKLANKNISIIDINQDHKKYKKYKKNNTNSLIVKKFIGNIKHTWKITSYSELVSNNNFTIHKDHNMIMNEKNMHINDLLPKIENNLQIDFYHNQDIIEKNVHNFPKGNITGVFLHNILEKITFQQILKKNWLEIKLKEIGMSNDWWLMLKKWIHTISHTTLIEKNFTLFNIQNNKIIKEMQFFLPINHIIYPRQIETIIRKYDNLSNQSIPLNFQPVKGLLNGYIDALILWKSKYYIIDYKSNWLGENELFYNQTNIKNSIIKHRYDIQYQLYTLAIHRHLKNKLIFYNYQQHFGGIIYIYIRGINIDNPGYSIYHTIPNVQCINELDLLFN
uniref:RecBCD enzyme subunit RecB n=1 Tax=Candidatus Aschnera chinzeii TaxID=1485666 RepID=A0AAT9G4T1_9ENTR|nr:MAG: exodeoxyribonuclease V subunit beta [Candidatus Aschnera chinzeii]